jgi:hypothetical protein
VKLSAVRGLSRPYPLAVAGRDPVYSVISHPPTFNLKYQAASGRRERETDGWVGESRHKKQEKKKKGLSCQLLEDVIHFYLSALMSQPCFF